MSWCACRWTFSDRNSLQAHRAHDATDTFAIDLIPLPPSYSRHTWPAGAWRLEVLRVNLAHSVAMFRVLRRPLRVRAGTVEPEHGTVSANTALGMLRLDQCPFVFSRTGQLFLSAMQAPC